MKLLRARVTVETEADFERHRLAFASKRDRDTMKRVALATFGPGAKKRRKPTESA